MPAVPFQATHAAPEDTPWSWDAATQNAILGDDKDNWAEYKKAHAWYDPDKDTVKAGFKLPHHKMVDGKLSAVWHGVSAAMARLEQSDIPDDELKATFDHLSKHYAQWDKTPPEWDRFYADVRERRQRQQRQTVARATALPLGMTRASISVTAAREGGTPNDSDMALINALARSSLDPARLYVFPAEISNQSIDAYYTQMSTKSIQQFAQDASRGVAVCDSHNHYQLPIGRSFYGTVVSSEGGQEAGLSTQSLAYMLRGMRTPSGMHTDDIIGGIEAGINADVSIGFIPDAYWCSICHMDMLAGWDCMHWPGQTYEIKDPDTGVVSNVLCIAVVDARLAEYSLVYDGATPNAMVLKAQRMLDSGRGMTREMVRQVRFVEDHCRVKLLDRWQGVGDGARRVDITAQVGQPLRFAIDGVENEEYDTMRGSEFITRYIETVQAEATRVGKQVSQANLDKLNAMHDKMRDGHDTMKDAMRELASFITDVSSGAGGDTDGDGDNPEGGDDPDGDGRSAPAPASVAIRADGSHDAFTGTHTHSHSAFGSQGGDESHSHEHSHDGDANHQHTHTENALPAGETRVGIDVPADGTTQTLTQVRSDGGQHEHLTPEQRAVFELGQRTLKDAQDEAIRWAVRANVVTAPEDEQRYRAMFARCSYDEVVTFRTSWEQIAKANLSPRGTWTPDRNAPGGGRWSDAPTMVGGRQTQAGDPNDPQRLAGSVQRGLANGKQTGVASRDKDDPALYGVRAKRRASK